MQRDLPINRHFHWKRNNPILAPVRVFILSFFYRIPAVKQREKSILRWISAIAVAGGVAFILTGVLLAIRVPS